MISWIKKHILRKMVFFTSQVITSRFSKIPWKTIEVRKWFFMIAYQVKAIEVLCKKQKSRKKVFVDMCFFLWRPLEENLATSSCRQENFHGNIIHQTFFWNELVGYLKTLELHFAKVIWPWCGFFSPVDLRRICWAKEKLRFTTYQLVQTS